jgi:hypothetical protein
MQDAPHAVRLHVLALIHDLGETRTTVTTLRTDLQRGCDAELDRAQNAFHRMLALLDDEAEPS